MTLVPTGGFAVGGVTSSYGAGGGDLWLLRITAGGDSLWSRTFGGTGSDRGEAVMADSTGRCWIAGYRAGGAASSNFYLGAADSTGAFLWERSLGGTLAGRMPRGSPQL